MKRTGLILVSLVVTGLLLGGCGSPSTGGDDAEAAITIEELDNGQKKLTLSENAARRLGVAMAAVEDQGAQKVIPYGAVIYDSQGATWAYAAIEGLTFQRAPIVVDTIDGEAAFLSDGPASGTQVVIVGAAELYGAETGVGGGH
jgi:protein-disulfide isomerase